MLKLVEFLPAKYKMLDEVHERSGNTSQYSAPAAVYATQDQRWVSLSGSTNALYANNCRAIGRPDLIDDPRFCTNPLRARNADTLNAIFRQWCGEHDLEVVLSAFHAAHGTIAPIYSADQICADEHFQARGILKDVPDEDFGSICMADVVPRFRTRPGGVRSAASGVGRHNAEVYGELLALGDDELARLAEKGVI
jgi:crotonobetainyl-CoA:carnitine CoA-transferase CaiB-like acyl-CoA transferase